MFEGETVRMDWLSGGYMIDDRQRYTLREMEWIGSTRHISLTYFAVTDVASYARSNKRLIYVSI